MPKAFNFSHIKLHGKQISSTEQRAMFMSAYFKTTRPLQFADMQMLGVKELQWGVGGGWGGILETRPGFRLTACKN